MTKAIDLFGQEEKENSGKVAAKFLKWWDAEYLSVVGVKYIFSHSKEMALIKKLVDGAGVE